MKKVLLIILILILPLLSSGCMINESDISAIVKEGHVINQRVVLHKGNVYIYNFIDTGGKFPELQELYRIKAKRIYKRIGVKK